MPFKLPMGRVDLIDVGSRKLTIQTEFITQPSCRIETRVYLGGELKKVSALEVDTEENQDLQQMLDEYHRARVKEITDGLRRKIRD
ncbi:MAG: hypothetical protein AB1714_21190 [Acidobacteriota bacterium]